MTPARILNAVEYVERQQTLQRWGMGGLAIVVLAVIFILIFGRSQNLP